MDSDSLNSTALISFYGGCGLVLVLFALVAHPRFLARIVAGSRAGELGRGWRLSGGSRRSGGRRVEQQKTVWEQGCGKEKESLDSKLGPFGFSTPLPLSTSLAYVTEDIKVASSPYDLKYSTSVSSTSSSLKPSTAARSPHLPLYFPSLLPTAFTLPLPAFFERFAISLTVGQAFVLVMYATVVTLAIVWSSDTLRDPTRSGLIAAAQIPLVIALGTKNSVVSALLGKGSEKYNYLHRFLGRTIFIASTLHVAPYLHKYAAANDFVKMMGKPVIATGALAFLALILISLSSIPVIRRKAFQFFRVTHWFGMAILLVSLSMHVPACLPFTISSASLYALDFFARLLFKAHIPLQHALLLPLSDGVTTLIECPSVTGGWRAGQHVFVRVLHPGIGMGNMWESHPFTIASGGEDEDGEPLRLFAKRVPGGWTERLYGFASSGDLYRGDGKGPVGRKCRVMLDGPYGGTGNTMLSSFSSALLVSGGSGITFSLAQALSLQAKALQGRCRSRSLDLVWLVQSEASLLAFMPYLQPLLVKTSNYHSRSSSTKLKPFHLRTNSLPLATPTTGLNYRALSVNVHVYVTRPSPEFAYDPSSFLPRNTGSSTGRLHVSMGRPNLGEIVNSKLSDAMREARKLVGKGVNPCGMVVGVCGPSGLVRGIRNVVGGLASGSASEVGGVEVITETFGC